MAPSMKTELCVLPSLKLRKREETAQLGISTACAAVWRNNKASGRNYAAHRAWATHCIVAPTIRSSPNLTPRVLAAMAPRRLWPLTDKECRRRNADSKRFGCEGKNSRRQKASRVPQEMQGLKKEIRFLMLLERDGTRKLPMSNKNSRYRCAVSNMGADESAHLLRRKNEHTIANFWSLEWTKAWVGRYTRTL